MGFNKEATANSAIFCLQILAYCDRGLGSKTKIGASLFNGSLHVRYYNFDTFLCNAKVLARIQLIHTIIGVLEKITLTRFLITETYICIDA